MALRSGKSITKHRTSQCHSVFMSVKGPICQMNCCLDKKYGLMAVTAVVI